MTDKLTLREEIFVHAYLAFSNATEAAKSAGYSAKTAYAKGSELLKRPRVAKALEAAKGRIIRKHNVTAERVIEEMAVIGFSDVRNYRMTEDGYVTLADGAPDSAMRAVKRIKRKLRLIPQKDGPSVTEVDTELELWSKDVELRHLGDHLKLFKEKRADDGDDELTPAEREERAIALLKKAIRRKKERATA